MIAPLQPPNESERLHTLQSLQILDTPTEERFDRITRLAARLFDVPIVLISLIDANRQWFKACVGLDSRETPREISFCGHAILQDETFVINDALLDPRFADNPLVVSEPFIRFYAGQLLRAGNGAKIGTLCVLDCQPRQFTAQDRAALSDLGAMVENELNATELNDALLAQRQSEKRYRQMFEENRSVQLLIDSCTGQILEANPAACDFYGYTASEMTGMSIGQINTLPFEQLMAEMQRAFVEKRNLFWFKHRLASGEVRDVEVYNSLVDMEGFRPLYSIIHDVTERRRAEKEVREQKEFTNNLLENCPVATVVIGTDHKVIVWNKAAEEFTGVAASQILGTDKHQEAFYGYKRPTLGDIIIDSTYDKLPDLYRSYSRSDSHMDTSVHAEDWFDLNGVNRYLVFDTNPIYNSQGHLIAAMTTLQDYSQQKQVEEALRQSKGEYQSLFDEAKRQAQELALIDRVRTALAREIDLTVVFRTVVEAIARTFGYSQVSLYLVENETLVLQHQVGYHQVIERIPVTEGVMGRVARTGEFVLLKDVHNDPAFLAAIDGIVSEVCVPIFDQSRVVGVLNLESTNGVSLSQIDLQLVRGVSEQISIAITRAQLHSQVQANEMRFRSLIENMQVGVILQGPQAEILVCNQASLDLLGLTEAQILGRTSFDPEWRTIHEDGSDFPGSTHPVPVAIATRQPVQNVTMGVYRPGSYDWVWLLVNAVPQLTSDGSVSQIICSFSDITERKEAEAALRENQVQLQDFFDNANDLIQIVSPTGRFIYVNHAWCETLGYTEQEVSQLNLREVVHPDCKKSSLDSFRRVLDGEKLDNIEVTYLTKAGKSVYLAGSGNCSFRDGKPYLTRAIFHDVSLIKETERKLIEAREAALEASRLKSEFLASMSHEIRTPMNAIIGLADLLWETPLNQEQREYLSIFRRAGSTLLDLINDILDLSKIEAGHLDLEQTDFELENLLEKTTEVLAVRAHEKNLELACQVAKDVPLDLIGDPNRLRQVVVNLIGNAIKFTEKGEVVVRVERDPQAEKPGFLRFSVKDTGIGIPGDKLHKIFESFSQVDSSTTRKYGGTGLGLTISKRLVELMQGQIWVESTPGAGSTFYFTARFEVQVEPLRQPKVPVADMTGLKVLVVDDNDTNRLILKEILLGQGALVTELASGEGVKAELEANKASGQPYQLVLLDGRMPGMDGFQVAEQVRSSPQLAGATIMMLTSDNRRGDVSRTRELGMSGYLVKPIKQTELLEAISNALQRAKTVQLEAVKVASNSSLSVPTPSQRLNILLVEDSSDNRLLIQVYLNKTAHALTMCENGEEAVEKFKSGSYDLILMDMQMPVMDGYTATRQIRQWEKDKGLTPTPIVALTAYALKEEAQKSLDAGCNAHVTKPIRKATLLETVAIYKPRLVATVQNVG